MISNIDDLSYEKLPEPQQNSYSPWTPSIPQLASVTELQKTSNNLLNQITDIVSNAHTFASELNASKYGDVVSLRSTLNRLNKNISSLLKVIEKGE